MRTKQLISFPRLNDCKGDISKFWYVEFSFRLPESDTLHKLDIRYPFVIHSLSVRLVKLEKVCIGSKPNTNFQQ